MLSLSPSSLMEAIRLDAKGDWSFDPRTGRYRGKNGRFLSRDGVMRIITTRIEALQVEARELSERLIGDEITLGQWQREFADLIKLINVQSFILGAGGTDRLVPADYLEVGRLLKEEYGYLYEFGRQLARGEVSLAQFQARVDMYIRKGRGSYWLGMNLSMKKAGFKFMQRFLSPMAEHCPECPEYAAKGKVEIGKLPLPTQKCTCRSNCQCSVVYYRD